MANTTSNIEQTQMQAVLDVMQNNLRDELRLFFNPSEDSSSPYKAMLKDAVKNSGGQPFEQLRHDITKTSFEVLLNPANRNVAVDLFNVASGYLKPLEIHELAITRCVVDVLGYWDDEYSLVFKLAAQDGKPTEKKSLFSFLGAPPKYKTLVRD